MKKRKRACGTLLASVTVLAVTYGLFAVGLAQGSDRPDLAPGESNYDPAGQGGSRALVTNDMDEGITPQDMVDALLDLPITDVIVANITFDGVANPTDPEQKHSGGTFSGGGTLNGVDPEGPIGIPAGIVLSSGRIDGAECTGGVSGSCNVRSNTSTNNGEPNDPNLDGIVAPRSTHDRAILEFDIKSNTVPRVLGFRYVFASEEYNYYVHTRYNDVCAIWVSGPGILAADQNRALIPPGGGDGAAGSQTKANVPVTINNVNNGNPFGTAPRVNPRHYGNNECGSGGLPPFPCGQPSRDSELDGFTKDGRFTDRVFQTKAVMLEASLPGNEKWYHVKIAVADTSDHVWDAALFVKGEVEGGACCECNGECVCLDGVAESDCDGVWVEGVLCGETGCGDTGMCCLPDGGCMETNIEGCYAVDGTFVDATTCDIEEGSCCLPDEECIVTTEECCLLSGGVYGGLADCVSADCTPTGNCCIGWECTPNVMTEADCINAGGEYQGDGTLCVPEACIPKELNIPTTSEWGLIVLTLLILTAGTVVIARRRRPLAS